jgi:large subunit ribosomal protein L5
MAEEKEVKTTAKKAATKTTAKKPAAKKAAAPKAAKEVEVKEAVKEVKKAAPKKAAKKAAPKAQIVNRLAKRYKEEVVAELVKKFNYSSVMDVPALEKVVINIGVGDATVNAKALEDAVRELADITGQAPVVTKAKKSIASFKLREGQSIGCKVTLRGVRMYDFIDKLFSVALPRVRDFRGVSKNAFDGRGNYTLGVKEQLIFPEINYDKVSKIRGMDIVIVTTAKTDAEAYALLEQLGMPFHK